MGYGVIGNTAVSGTAILGSSPGTPALSAIRSALDALSYAGNPVRLRAGQIGSGPVV